LIVGEVGLTGEVRAVSQTEKRIQEGVKFGFKKCIIPENNRRYLNLKWPLEVYGVRNVEDALEIVFTK